MRVNTSWPHWPGGRDSDNPVSQWRWSCHSQKNRSRARTNMPEARHRDHRLHAQSASGPAAAPFPSHPSAVRQWCSVYRHRLVPALRQGSCGGSPPVTGTQPSCRARLRQAGKEAALGAINRHKTPPEPVKAVPGFPLPSLPDQRWQIESHDSGSRRPR